MKVGLARLSGRAVKARALAARAFAVVLVITGSSPAAAWDPEAVRPQRSPQRPAPAPAGLYRVTEVYIGDVVTRRGPTTTYSTATRRDDPGTYARVLEVLPTGQRSANDRRAFNGRATLSDGRPVAGAYYENFVRTAAGFVPVSVVFFQDDAETRAADRVVPSRAPSARPPSPAPARVAATPRPTIAPRPATPAPTPAPSRRSSRTQPPAERSEVTPRPATPRPSPSLRVGLAPAPQGDVVASLEVLRGRRVELWPRAWLDGDPANVRDWRLVSGELVVLGPLAGPGDLPLVARWDRLAPSGWPIRLALAVASPSGPVEGFADVTVVVRSPALIQ